MRKFIFIFLMLLGCCASSGTNLSDAKDQVGSVSSCCDCLNKNMALKLIQSTVRVKKSPQSTGCGSGIFVFSGRDKEDRLRSYFLTCYHVVHCEAGDDAYVERFIYRDNLKIIALLSVKTNVVAIDKELDLALLEVISNKHLMPWKGVEFASRQDKITVYEKVYAVGCGLGDPPYISDGHLNNYDSSFGMHSVSTSIVSGNSGGGVFLKNGKLLGIAHGVKTNDIGDKIVRLVDHSGLVITMNSIKSFLTEWGYRFIFDPNHIGDLSGIGSAAVNSATSRPTSRPIKKLY